MKETIKGSDLIFIALMIALYVFLTTGIKGDVLFVSIYYIVVTSIPCIGLVAAVVNIYSRLKGNWMVLGCSGNEWTFEKGLLKPVKKQYDYINRIDGFIK